MVEPTKVEQSKEYTGEDFVKEYQALCKKMGFQVVVTPVYVATNHGSFETVLQHSVGKLPKQQV